ncbi:sugar ABC transporter ATP-binding protein [Phragmitibacter flavus]|uniref:Sugar ABC transporter ATP-binding protein n=1 Tax=Phragmitibacter flavus TaxID=2576071 RepID=A0A5R8KD84_9BACT|nr:sugar ABC transporter ATP-binding protein [Phragmitibacter flavus]TLD70272.1 sugar ABC transporter ATP-binding protein [Phragmitibacter flavus]
MADLLRAINLTKRFPGVLALSDVSLSLGKGEVVAVIGENGAGKSTLMKVLAGIGQADEGKVFLEGDEVILRSVKEAQDLGIALIHQELNLADNLDVAGNVWLGREPRKWGLVQKKVMREKTAVILKRLGANFKADTAVSKLSLGQQQLVEIAKALSMDAKVIIMDEPTSSLSASEVAKLYEVIADLKKRGLGILYISHRLGEVEKLADRVVGLRDGCNVGELLRFEVDHDAMVRMMVGRDLSQVYERTPQKKGWVVLDVQGLRTKAHPERKFGFDLRQGEILGLAGLVGSGRTEVLQALFGIEPPVGGDVLVNGEKVRIKHPRDAMSAGMALVPEDRKKLGVFLEESVKWNVGLPGLSRHARGGVWVDGGIEKRDAERMAELLKIKSASLKTKVGTLSGGNQQKVALGKWLALGPGVLLLDEPTRGIDVGAKREIYQLMERLAGQGMAILFVSSEMEEVIALSDRVLVMHEGELMGVLQGEGINEEAIMSLALGHHRGLPGRR